MTNNIQKAFKTKSKLRGMADGGKVRGKGGPTDDKVGPVMLSDGEYVLPADTVEIVGRENLDALRLATHDFVDEDNKPKVSGLRKMANGGTFYVDPDGVASRQMPPGRAVVPYQPPSASSTAMPPRAPQVIDAAGAAKPAPPAAPAPGPTARIASGLRNLARGAAITSPIAGFGDYKADTGGVDTSASGTLGYLAKGEFGKAGTSLSGGAAEALADSARGIAKTIDGIAGIFGADPGLTRKLDNAITGITGGYLSLRNPDSSKVTGGVQPTPDAQAPAAAPAAAPQSRPGKLPGMTNVPADVRTSFAGMPATPVQPQSYQSLRLAEMGVPVGQQNLPPVTEDTRRSLLREGGGTPGQYVNLGSYGGDTNIYGTASKPGGRIDTFVGVGASSRPGGSGPQEDPIMGEIRSALRGLTAGTNDRGGGGAVIGGGGSGNAREINEINARYDALLRAGSGRNIVRGLDWSQRHGLDVERARAAELNELARNQATLRGQDMQAATAANNARVQALQTLGTMADQRSARIAQAQTDMLKALQDVQKAAEARMEDNAKVFESIADTFAEGDKSKASQYRELLATLPPELHQVAQELAPEDKRAFYTNIMRQQLGRNDGLVLGRDLGATVQNAAIGGLLGRMTRFAHGPGGKAVDRALGKIPRVGPLLSALRPAENLSRFGTLIGAAAGAYATPEVENLTRWDPVARDPVSGAALPARKDLREAATYGVFDTYLNPFDDSVQTVSGRRTDPPTPDEEEAARRFRSALRN